MSVRFVVIVALFVVLSGCGDSDSTQDADTTTATTPTTVSSTSTTTSASTTTTTMPPSTTSTTVTTTTLAPVEGPIVEPTLGPPAGTIWMVVGVRHDDRLNVRAIPGVEGEIVGSLAPTDGGVEASGTAVIVGRSIWWEVSSVEGDGWVNARYLGAEGVTDDVTAAVVADVGAIPSAPTMDGLAEIVIESRWLPLGTEGSFVVVRASSTSGSMGEITVDAFPAESGDSVRGGRLVVFGQQDGANGPYTLKAVEETTICWRGADADGLCL